jgi:hypothetical protein
MTLTPRQQAMAAARATKEEQTGQRRPFGSWNERDSSGWTICERHNFGIQPGTSCLRCRLERIAAR